MSQEAQVGISEACEILKVSETALRQWTDEGKIKAFVTPGGHRRYLVSDLKEFMSSSHKAVGVKDLAAELEDTARPLREIGLKLFTGTPWSDRLTRESKQELSELGRRLLNLLIRYVTVPSEREISLIQVRDTGKNLGLALAGLRLSLTDAVEAFVMHRETILNVATGLMKKREAFSGRVVDAIPLVARIMDEALVSLVAAYQEYRNGNQDYQAKKETTL
jgi:excisionase family DNA binding protein